MSISNLVQAPDEVKQAISHYPNLALRDFNRIRKLIFQTAKKLPIVGELTETTKWGEPAFLTEKSRSGSTIRVAWSAKNPDKIGIYFNCKTTLVDTMRSLFAEEFEFQGNRAVLMGLGNWSKDSVCHCIEMALTYHVKKSSQHSASNSV